MSKKKLLATYIASALAIGGCAEANKNEPITQKTAGKELSLGEYIVMGLALAGGVQVFRICRDHSLVRSGKKDDYDV